MTKPSTTPRTEAVLDEMLAGDGIPKCMEWTRLEQHARTLERELAELEGLRRLRKLLEEAVDTVDGEDGERPRGNAASQVLTDWAFREWGEHGRYV